MMDKHADTSPNDLLSLRLDYAWKYFDSAATKRMQFINYFLIIVGILANAYVQAVKEDLYVVACAICLFGLASAATFILLDHRMLVFVNRGLSVLDAIERQALFPEGYSLERAGVIPGRQLGLARIESDEDIKGSNKLAVTKVKFWVRYVVMGGAACLFLIGAIHSLIMYC